MHVSSTGEGIATFIELVLLIHFLLLYTFDVNVTVSPQSWMLVLRPV